MTPPFSFSQYIQLIIDSDLNWWGTPEQYEALTHEEQQIIQSLKRFKKRKQK